MHLAAVGRVVGVLVAHAGGDGSLRDTAVVDNDVAQQPTVPVGVILGGIGVELDGAPIQGAVDVLAGFLGVALVSGAVAADLGGVYPTTAVTSALSPSTTGAPLGTGVQIGAGLHPTRTIARTGAVMMRLRGVFVIW